MTINGGQSKIDFSNYKKKSFQLTNMGSKNIVAVFLDVTSATFGDMVFDPFGFAGDDVSKPLTIDVDEGTGSTVPHNVGGANGLPTTAR